MAWFARKQDPVEQESEAVVLEAPTLPAPPAVDAAGLRSAADHSSYLLSLVEPLPAFGMPLLEAWNQVMTEDIDSLVNVPAASTAKVAVIIPAGFEGTIETDGHAEVAVLVDGTEPNSARVARSYSVAINQLASTAMTREWAERQGIDVSGVGTLDARIRTWYNPDQRSSDFLIPGLMVVILAIVTIQQTAVTLVRERTLGTEEQLEVSPMHKLELMIGKLIPWTLLALVDVVVSVAIGVLVLDVPLRGSVAALAVGAVLFILANLGMGLAVSAVAPSEDTANIAAMMIALLPSFMLSGFVFPLNQMPVVLQWISAVLPARYMVSLSRGVFLKGAGFAELWPDLLALAIAAAVLIAVSTLMYSRKARR